MDLTALRQRVSKLLPYRRNVRPAAPDSFPPFMDSELLRIATANQEIVRVLQDIDARLTALETP